MVYQSQNSLETAEIPLLPLKDIVVFPHMILPVFIHEDICIQAVEQAMAGDRRIFLSAFKVPLTPEEDSQHPSLLTTFPPPFDVYHIGTVGSVMRTRKLPDGRMKVLVQGVEKAYLKELIHLNQYPLAKIQIIKDIPYTDRQVPEIEALVRSVRDSLEKLVSLGKIMSPDILMLLEEVKDPSRLADLIAANLGLSVLDGQKILGVLNPVDRLSKVYSFLAKEIEVFQMQARIQTQAKEEIGKLQKEHYLREQIKVLKNELGDTDPKEDTESFWKRLEEKKLPQEAFEEISRQIKRLERMHPDTSEAILTRSYCETVLSLPWNEESEDLLNIKNVVHILNDDHYGLDAIKDRIVEYMAVKKLNPKARSPIICFVGPPGVGKTSLGKSIARAIGRQFARIALGGVRDEADIRGHRKTYVGAFPGRVIQAIKSAATKNPVIMLDEIDKLGSDHRGDPASALLEVLDPEQNSHFVDHYLGINFDLSKVMFIANANTLDTIPAALKDRLEVIEVQGYSEDEKLEIASKFLIPKHISEAGLEKEKVFLTKSSVHCLIRGYTRESGLRGLEKKIASVCRKIARQVTETENHQEHYKVTPQVVEKLLGAKKYGSDFYHRHQEVGVSLAMAYTPYGGEILAIETSLFESHSSSHGHMTLTGHLGEVMKESAQTALGYIRSHGKLFGIPTYGYELHVHVPQGAVPKDGPSAGIALVTSMLSAILKEKQKERVAMTGEITLHGKVLPIGGLKEKVLAALRENIVHIVIPEGNRETFSELPIHIKKQIKPHFVSHYEDVYAILFDHSHLELNDTPSSPHVLAG